MERFDSSRLAGGLIMLGPALLLPGLFGLKDHFPWAIATLVLAAATIMASLLVARADSSGRSIRDVLSGDEDTPGGQIGGGLFAGFVVGAILFSAANQVAPYIVLGLYLVTVGAILIHAWAGPRTKPVRGARARPQAAADVGRQILDALRSANVISAGESGVKVTSGAELGDRMMSHTAACRKCGAPIQFQEGGLLAMDMGIKDQVVVCPSCRSIYEVQIGPSGMTLTADVTARYGASRSR